jgi:hypothetical protein
MGGSPLSVPTPHDTANINQTPSSQRCCLPDGTRPDGTRSRTAEALYFSGSGSSGGGAGALVAPPLPLTAAPLEPLWVLVPSKTW